MVIAVREDIQVLKVEGEFGPWREFGDLSSRTRRTVQVRLPIGEYRLFTIPNPCIQTQGGGDGSWWVLSNDFTTGLGDLAWQDLIKSGKVEIIGE